MYELCFGSFLVISLVFCILEDQMNICLCDYELDNFKFVIWIFLNSGSLVLF